MCIIRVYCIPCLYGIYYIIGTYYFRETILTFFSVMDLKWKMVGGHTSISGRLTIGLKRTHYVSVGPSLFTSDRCLITTIPRDWSRISEALSPPRLHGLYIYYIISIYRYISVKIQRNDYYYNNYYYYFIIILYMRLLTPRGQYIIQQWYTCKCIIYCLYMCVYIYILFSRSPACELCSDFVCFMLVRIAVGGRGTIHLPENRH